VRVFHMKVYDVIVESVNECFFLKLKEFVAYPIPLQKYHGFYILVLTARAEIFVIRDQLIGSIYI